MFAWPRSIVSGEHEPLRASRELLLVVAVPLPLVIAVPLPLVVALLPRLVVGLARANVAFLAHSSWPSSSMIVDTSGLMIGNRSHQIVNGGAGPFNTFIPLQMGLVRSPAMRQIPPALSQDSIGVNRLASNHQPPARFSSTRQLRPPLRDLLQLVYDHFVEKDGAGNERTRSASRGRVIEAYDDLVPRRTQASGGVGQGDSVPRDPGTGGGNDPITCLSTPRPTNSTRAAPQ
jgi:hypothetical protein